MSLESFKSFVKKRPSLASYVASGNTTWQKLYETFEMYGENENVWNNLTSKSSLTIKDMINTIKNIDVTEVQNSIKSLQKGIKYIEGLVKEKENPISIKETYTPRPLYKYFDD